MFLIELFVPKGRLSEAQRNYLSERIINEIVASESAAPASVIEASLANSHVIVHEPEQWVVGGKTLNADEPPRYIVRASVPSAWRREVSEALITIITRVFAEADDDPQRLYQEPHAWIYVMGVPEGGSGTLGRAMKSSKILKMLTHEHRATAQESLPQREVPPGMGIDPICGMLAPLTDGEHGKAITYVHEDTTYAFCSHGCRALFIEELEGEAALVP
jgi:YHS domain-containing protein